jgi:hypothetical protein
MIILYKKVNDLSNQHRIFKQILPAFIRSNNVIVSKADLKNISKIEFSCEASLVILLNKFSCLPEFTENENGHIEFNGPDAKFITENLFYKNS